MMERIFRRGPQITKLKLSRKTTEMMNYVDNGVVRFVALLNCMGIFTISSCEGHVDRGRIGPWIRMASEQVCTEDEVITQKYIDIRHDWYNDPNLIKLYNKEVLRNSRRWKRLNSREIIPLTRILDMYNNTGPYPVELVCMIQGVDLQTRGSMTPVTLIPKKELYDRRNSFFGFQRFVEDAVLRR